MMRRVLAISLFLLLPATVFSFQQQIRFERISIENGLSHVQVTAITQDQSGFMWIGTVDGLNRYDGYDFVVHKSDPTDPSSLSDSDIRTIAEDNFGNLWVGTRAGLNRFDRGPASFIRYLHDPTFASTIGSDEVNVVYVDHEGVVWIGTQAGLDRYDHATDSFTRFQFDRENLPRSIAQGPVVAIYEDQQNVLWVATRDNTHGALDSFDRTTSRFTHHYGCPMKDHGDCTIPLGGLEGHRPIATDINGIYRDLDGAFWLATDSGIVKETTDGYLESYKFIPDDLQTLSNDRVLAPVEDLGRTLWFGTKGGGLNRIGEVRPVNWIDSGGSNKHQVPDDPRWTSIFERFRHDPADPHSLSSDQISAVFEDRFGVIWIGTADAGLNKFHPDGMNFGYYKHLPENSNSLTDNLVSAVAEDQSGILWIGTQSGGLNKVDRASSKVTRYTNIEGDASSLPAGAIDTLFVDEANNLWVGNQSGLSRYNRNNNTFENINVYPFGPSILPVFSIAEYPAGVLWLGTSGMVARYDIASQEYEYLIPDSDAESTLLGNVFGPIIVDATDKIWIGTINAGVNQLDPKTGEIQHFRSELDNNNRISDNHVTSIFETKDGAMWFGTRRGLDKLDVTAGTFSHYTIADGLPAMHVVDMTADKHGDLWITTDSAGVGRLDMDSDTFKHYNVISGLQGNSNNRGAAITTRSGEIVLGGSNGFNMFRPSDITDGVDRPAIALAGIQAADEATFKFAALNYANPAQTTYAYMLEGYDQDWKAVNATQRTASYQSIEPGEYTFRVRARLLNGDWGENNASFELSVLPPMWQTTYAYFIYATFLAASTILFFKMRSRALIERAELLKTKVAERTRQIGDNEKIIQHQADHLEELLQVKEKFFANISHEFRTPLTLILGPIERLIKSTSNAKDSQHLRMIRSNSRRLLRLVDQLLGLSRLSTEEPLTKSAQPLLPVVENIVRSFQPLAQEKKIALDVVDSDGLWVLCSPDALEKILLNLVSNAIKYTRPRGWIKVRVTANGGDMVKLSVSDSGIGISSKFHDAVFERFFRIDDSGEATPGAGLGLALVKELTQSYGGSIELESSPGQGTTVSVLLPRQEVGPNEDLLLSPVVTSKLIPLEVAASGHRDAQGNGHGNGQGNGQESLLIVEDNLDMQEYLVSLLSDTYHCQVAGNGESGVNLALESIPDLVLCDVMLPRMDGFMLSETLKTNELTSHIPIVLLTGRGDSDSRLKGLREHVDDYLTKPFSDEELSLRIANLLAARKAMKRKFSRLLFDGTVVSSDMSAKDLQFLNKLQAILQRHHGDADFRVDRMSGEMAMSDRQLQRKLKAITDNSPAEYLRSFRLHMAMKQLKQGQQVGLVAEAVGFSSSAYFASCFKAEFGATPSEFQQTFN